MRRQLPTNLDLDRVLDRLALLLLARIGLGAHDATAPVAALLLSLLEVALLDGGDELGELALVLSADLSQGQNGGGLGGMLAVMLKYSGQQE